MAAVAGAHSAHATLAAATEDIVTLTGAPQKAGEIVNHGTDVIYFRTDEVTIVAEADETEVVLGGERLTIRFGSSGTVNLISAGTPTYSVIVL